MQLAIFHGAVLGSFIGFIVLRAYMDYILIEKHKIHLTGDYKTCTAILTCIVVAYANVLVALKPSWLLSGSLLFAYGFLFDTLLNYLRGKPKDHLGIGPIDTFWSVIPYQFYVRLTLLIILICLNIQSLL